jgi:hypothetical protein
MGEVTGEGSRTEEITEKNGEKKNGSATYFGIIAILSLSCKNLVIELVVLEKCCSRIVEMHDLGMLC